jgi:hypothetical protein
MQSIGSGSASFVFAYEVPEFKIYQKYPNPWDIL